jgi:hypothetical protein
MRQLVCFLACVALCSLSPSPAWTQDATPSLLDRPQETFTCSNCGKEVPGDATKCPHCGIEFDDVYVPPKELLSPTPPPPNSDSGRGPQQPAGAPQGPAGAPAAPQAPANVAGGGPEVPFFQSTSFKIGVFVVTALILLRWFFRN